MDDLLSDDDTIEVEEKDTLLYHVVLPRVLPQKPSEKLREVELEMVQQMINAANECNDRHDIFIPAKTIALLRNVKTFHVKCKSADLLPKIQQLRPGDSFAVFIRSQQCLFMIHVPHDEPNIVQNVIVAAFPGVGSMDPNEIYLHNSDIEVIFFLYFLTNFLNVKH